MNSFAKQFIAHSTKVLFSIAALILGAMPAHALAVTKYKIDIEVSGEANASTKTEAFKSSPTMIQNANVASTFKISAVDKSDRLRLTVTAAEPEGETVMVDLKIEMRQSDGSYTNSASKIKATLGTAISMALETDTGAELDLSLKLSKAP
jgi:hypothetical protein